jgi:sugar transferase (PEP-CTERM/EpsH1 system associated)
METGASHVGALSGTRSTPLIAHVIHRLAIGGMENGLVNLINHMPVGLYRHAIICLTDATEFRERIMVPDVAVFELHRRDGIDLRMFYRLWRLLRRLRPDIVHTRNLATVECQFPGWLSGVPGRIHGEHGWNIGDLDGSRRKARLIRRGVRPLVDRYIAVSRQIAGYLTDAIGVRASQVDQIYNGVDLKRFQPRESTESRSGYPAGFSDTSQIVFGTVGRLQAVKDQATLIRAFARLREQLGYERDRLRLVIVGDGPLREELEYIRDSLGLADSVWLAGARDDIDLVLGGMDVFVLPSLAEGISNTVLEAMAAGRAVIATRVGGNMELVVHGQTGTLIDVGDVEQLEIAMREYVLTPDLIRSRGMQARRRAEEYFSLDRMVEGYRRTYENVLGCVGKSRDTFRQGL